MNRNSVLNVFFTDAEAGFVSEDEPEDCVEEESDYDDEIEIDYIELDVAAAISLEEELIVGPSTQPPDSLIVQGEGQPQPRRRGRPKKNSEIDYTEIDVAAAISLEEELFVGPSTQPPDLLIVQREERPRRRGRPRKNPEPISSASTVVVSSARECN